MKPIKAWALVWHSDWTAVGRSGDWLLVFRTKRAALRDRWESDEPGTVKVIPVEIRELPKRRTK